MMKMTPAAIQAALNGDIDDFIAASTPGGIEAQEAAGQKQFVANQTLPKECQKEELEKIGFVFGDEADDIFVYVKFPEGWKKEPTDHSMWNNLIDDKGRKRGAIFYKAAFYDRSSHMYLNGRFSVQQNYDIEAGCQYKVLDGDKVVFETKITECEKYSSEYWKAADDAEKAAIAWIEAKYPDWRNNSAYWD